MNLNTSLNAIPAEIKEQFRLWRNAKRVTPLLTRLYVYSIIFDPFLFFVIADRITVGFSLSVSRLFMFLFYGFWFFRLFRAKAVTPFVALNKYWILFMLFFAYVLVFNFLSFLLGENYMLKLVAHDDDGTSDVAIFLAYPYVRLCLELASFCLTIFHYFWVGPRMLIKRDGYYFLCSSFLLICYISFAFGLINYSSALLLGQNIYPRHLAEYISSSPSFSGVRFQGLAGEPRDAFVQLVLFFVLFKFLCVVGIVNLKHSYVSFITLLTFTCLVLTISASGLFGVAVFGILFAARQTLYNFSLKNIAASAVLSIIVVVILAVSFEYIDRLFMYKEALGDLISLINTRDELPELVLVQLSNFYPLIYWAQSCERLNLWTCLFGGGFGTSFALNSIFYGTGVNNPHAYISRLIPELGFIGFGLFIYVILNKLFKQLDLLVEREGGVSKFQSNFIKTCVLALLAAVLAHKSNNLYFGILVISLGLQHAYLNTQRHYFSKTVFQ